ncbi:MAG: Rne/Rng family ribonuclease [Propionibacteriaceae bacterium]|nr:Rne/Rng family ribonuclease [Propionibacteriaceae bacterium]
MPDEQNQVVTGLSSEAAPTTARRRRTVKGAPVEDQTREAEAGDPPAAPPKAKRRSAAERAEAAEAAPKTRGRRSAAKPAADSETVVPAASTDPVAPAETVRPTRRRTRSVSAEAPAGDVVTAEPVAATDVVTAEPTAETAAETAGQPVKSRSSRARAGASEEAAPRRRSRAAQPAEADSAVGPDQPQLIDPTPAEDAPADRSDSVKSAKNKRDRSKKGADPASPAAAEGADPADQSSSEPTGRRLRRRSPRNEPAAAVSASEPEIGSEPGSDAVEDEAGSADPIGEALNELSQSRSRSTRNRRVRSAGALDDLAAAIAGEAESDSPADSPDEGEEDDDGETGEGSRRRRRRRGGRRHKRGQEAGEGDDESDEAEDGAPAEAEGDSKRRRRRRRRRGEEVSEAEDDPKDVVVRLREPRSARGGGRDGVAGIEGSTRLEAKRQRRREGRAASRRRAPILSEAEFLARRESVHRTMLIRQAEHYSQIAVLEDDILVEHYVDRAEATSLIGNVYLGRVQNVLPSMEAAFIDIGRGRNAVLFAGEVDWDRFGAQGGERKVEQVMSSGQTILVQVTKDPVGAKGARLTSHISIPGRYVVYAPGGHLSGISRKLADSERSRLKSILDEVVGHEASVIIRTAAEGATQDELVHDTNRLKAQWEVIDKKAAKGQSPQLLYSEPDLSMRIVRDLFTEDFTELVVDGNGSPNDAFDTVEAYVQHVAPALADRLKRWDRSEGDLFARYRIDEQIAKALDRKVHLPSGGTLIIDRTEAMTVIDVNTGKFTGSGGTLEATVTSNNLEAAEEIVRQLRLRDIGGIIVIDFIDMVLPSNRDLLLKRLIECLSRDRTRHQVAEVTSLGLVQMTRKRVGSGLSEAFSKPCEVCSGLGYIRVTEPVEHQVPADGGERGHRHRKGRD